MVEINKRDGSKVEIKVVELNPRDRAKILKQHLKISEFMKASQNKEKESSIFDFLKDEDGTFDFINDVLSAGLPGIKLEEITSSEADRIAGDVIGEILGLNSKN